MNNPLSRPAWSHLPRSLHFLAAGCLGFACFHAHAADTTVSTAKSEDVVKLSEFSVTADSNKGYIASESITGSRVATAIKDLPFAVNVITSEFLDDFGSFDLSDGLGYTSSVTALDNGGNNTIRGYTSQYMLRDGFWRLGMNDKISVDRIEIIKGPSAAIYGQAQPGGMVNVITKRPRQTDHVTAMASVMAGSYGSNREEVSVNGPVSFLPKTYFLLTGSDYERHYDAAFTTLRNRSAGLMVQHVFGGGGVLVGQLGYMRNQTHSPLSTVPEMYNSVTKRYEGLAFDLATLNQNGPRSETSRDVYDSTLTFEQRLSDVFSVRATSGWWHRHKWLFNAGNGSQYDYLNKVLVKGTPVKGLINEDGGNVQADLLARYKLLGGSIDNKTLLTFDFSDYYRWDPNWQLANAYQISNTLTTVAPSGPYWFKNIYVGQPIDYNVPVFDTNIYNNITRYNKNRASVWGGNLRQQASLLQDRLMMFASLRYDAVKLNLHNYLGAGQVVKGTSTAWSPSGGFNFKATRNISFYGSRSNGFNANAQNQTAANGLQPNERSYGYDYGIKSSLLDDRLVFTTGGYYIVRRNVSDTELLPNGTTIASYSGSQLARGFEFDFTYRVTDDLTFVGGYGHVNAKYTYFGRSLGSVGYPTSKVAPDNLGVALKYNFSGALKGLSMNAGVQYLSKIAAENPNTGDIFAAASAGGGYLGNDGRRDIKIPSYALLDLGLHYTFRPEGSRVSHTIDLNLKNTTDKSYITAARFPGDGRGIYVTYRLGL